jgi:hypothetical protein
MVKEAIIENIAFHDFGIGVFWITFTAIRTSKRVRVEKDMIIATHSG